MSVPVKCTGRKCRGDFHETGCARYVVEIAKLAAKHKSNRKPDERKRHDGPLKGETPEQKADRAREIGKKGGRPPGSPNILPLGAVKILRAARLGVRKEFSAEVVGEEVAGAAGELAGYALERTVQVVAGTINAAKAPSILKGAKQIRDDLCNPVEQKTSLAGTMTLEQIVAKAAEKVTGG